ncbi:hydroxypyruvate isomerase family protein [Hydrogenophaga sp. RWCD_12]|uniref:hydroxypyruvate isomerase family protein n=1 Tax=Hydrogenophaga sp. RWCD_12 TaxID=3391190 RepID=UPI003984F4DE
MFAFSANLSTLFTDLPFPERFAAAKASGFDAVECQFPYAHPAEELAALLQTHGQRMVLHNLPAGEWAAGERGIACHPDRVSEFLTGVEQAIGYAKTLGVPGLNCLAGIPPAGVEAREAMVTLRANLRTAARMLAGHGLHLLVEPINSMDIPGFFVDRPAQAIALIEELRQAHALDNLFLQYDIYHAQRMEGELAGHLQRWLPLIAHIQIADNPGRAEPGTGEIRYAFLFDWLERIGYQGHVGCEYFPADKGPGGTQTGLGWVAAHGRRASGERL